MFAFILKLKSSMKSSIANRALSNKLNDNIFTIINVACFLLTLLKNKSIGTYTSLIILFILYKNKDVFYSGKDQLFKFFICINLITGLSYLYNGVNFIIFFQAISYSIIPSLLYLLGAKQYRLGVLQESLANNILYPSVILMGIGLFFYLIFPDFYFSNIGQDINTYKWGLADYRFGSYISSSNLGSLCVSCIPLYFVSIKTRGGLFNSVILIIILTSLALCMQRSSWAVSILFFCIIIFRTINFSVIIPYIVMLLVLLFVGGFFIRNLFTEEQIKFMITRFSNLDLEQMSSERVKQWMHALNIFYNNPWGFGLGTLGHKASEAGYSTCSDGNYFKILGEIGIVGFALFIGMILKALKKYWKGCSILALVILGFSLQAIGSNVFELYFSSYVFWYILGYLHAYKPIRTVSV